MERVCVHEFDVTVVGAGVVGLAIARACALRGLNTLVLERNRHQGMETSSRNSEVIHAGIYYANQSLKAIHCVEGRKRLYAYCEARGVPYRQTGKLIVATSSAEEAQLESIIACAEANGLCSDDRLIRMSKAQVEKIEPEIVCRSALFSPSTGIVDSHVFMQSLLGDAEAHGALFSFGSDVESIECGRPHRLRGKSNGDDFHVTTKFLFVAAGLHSATLARQSGIQSRDDYWLKGNYFTLSKRGPFKHLIYPVPTKGGLGVHVTLDLQGGTRFGPDTEPVDCEDYHVEPSRMKLFEQAIRTYWPNLPDNALQPAYAGIRPKLHSSDTIGGDFLIDGPQEHGKEGLIVLHGIESPGLTASLSLADAAYDAMFSS